MKKKKSKKGRGQKLGRGQWSYKFETTIKRNAFLAFIFNNLGFRALNRLNLPKNDTFINVTCIRGHTKWAWQEPVFPDGVGT